MGITINDFPDGEPNLDDWPYIRFDTVFDLRFVPIDEGSSLMELRAVVSRVLNHRFNY